MNRSILIVTVLALCFTQIALSANMRGSEERVLLSIPSSRATPVIGATTSTTTTPVTTTTTVPVTTVEPVVSTTTPPKPATISIPSSRPTPVLDTTSTTAPADSTTSTPAPVVNTTEPVVVANTTDSAPVVNTTQPTPVVNTTQPAPVDNSGANTTVPVVNTTQPAPAANTTQPVVDNSTPAPTNDTSATNGTYVAPNDSGASESDPSTSTKITIPSSRATPVSGPVYIANPRKNDVNTNTFAQDCLNSHNNERALVGVGPLVWADDLARNSYVWSQNMAVNGFRHSGFPGENIASTTYTSNVLGRLLGLWIKEKNWYIPGCKYGSCSSTGAEVGHYTQMVWRGTTYVGCGFFAGSKSNYLTCQYSRYGNIIGQRVF